jgi:hypothetical protein
VEESEPQQQQHRTSPRPAAKRPTSSIAKTSNNKRARHEEFYASPPESESEPEQASSAQLIERSDKLRAEWEEKVASIPQPSKEDLVSATIAKVFGEGKKRPSDLSIDSDITDLLDAIRVTSTTDFASVLASLVQDQQPPASQYEDQIRQLNVDLDKQVDLIDEKIRLLTATRERLIEQHRKPWVERLDKMAHVGATSRAALAAASQHHLEEWCSSAKLQSLVLLNQKMGLPAVAPAVNPPARDQTARP